jgi:hypothetical protein
VVKPPDETADEAAELPSGEQSLAQVIRLSDHFSHKIRKPNDVISVALSGDLDAPQKSKAG